MEADASVTCPVCLAEFPPPRDGAAFALHVAKCTAPPTSSSSSPSSSSLTGARKANTPPPPMRSCPMCQHVYARGTLPHEISFHEHECARVNERPRDKIAGNKRTRETSVKAPDAAAASTAAAEEEEDAAATPTVKLFPSDCFLCGTGGRSLLRCEGSCARVFHFNCVEELQAAHSASASVEGGNSARRAQQQHWTCAECFRGLHRCHTCGFLGSDAKDLVRCAVVDCGLFFHRACLSENEATEYVCPRHTCAKCGAMETDMTRCLSCVKCFAMTHLRCRPGAATHHTTDASPHVNTTGAPLSAVPPAAGTNANLHVCSLCAVDRPTVKPSPHLGNSLRRRCANGDIVLILEYNNALLPATAKAAAPGVYNQWGVVMSVENMEPAGAGNQLLSVSVFSDDSRIIVPNRYVLRVASANSFATPTAMVRELIKWHSMTELNLRTNEDEQSAETRNAILESACKAFAARLDALSIPTSDALAQASEGAASLQKFQRQAAPRHYREESDTAEDFAPAYMFLDTRSGQSTTVSRTNKSKQSIHQSGSTGTPPPNDGDVDMDGGNEEAKTEDNAEHPTDFNAGMPPKSTTRSSGSAEGAADGMEREPVNDCSEEVDAHPIADEGQTQIEGKLQQEAMETLPVADDAHEESSQVDAVSTRAKTIVNASEVTKGATADGGTDSDPSAGNVGDDAVEGTIPIPADDDEDEVMESEEASNNSLDTVTTSISIVEAHTTIVTGTLTETVARASESITVVTIERDVERMDSDRLVMKVAKEEADVGIVNTSPVEDNKEAKEVASDHITKVAALETKEIVSSPVPNATMTSTNDNKKRTSPPKVEESPTAKRAKITPGALKHSHPHSMAASKFEPLPAVSAFNITQVLPTFTPQHHFEKPMQAATMASGIAHSERSRKLTRKEAVLAEFPPALISELERDVDGYFQHGNAGVQREHRLPKDADSFPWAAHAALFRPAFYRPSVVLNRARGGRRIDSVSRLLVSQDKRNLKCFIQSAQHAPLTCPSNGGNAANHHAFLVVDLLSVESFAQLMAAVRCKLVVALEDRPRFTQELFQMDPRSALCWLEQQQSRKLSEQQLGMTLWYCCFDGSRKMIALDEKPSQKAASEWLCFCANACHLTLALALPPLAKQHVHGSISRGVAPVVAVRGL